MLAVLAIMATLVMPAFAADGTEPTTPAESTGVSTATGGTDGGTWYYENDDDAVSKLTDTGAADINVWALTTQTDSYAVTIEWGVMTFNYAFGLWNPADHSWDGLVWRTADFDGAKDKVTVRNHSSRPINAGFIYTGAASGTHTTGTFTLATGNLHGAQTGTMALPAVGYEVAFAAAPYADTYLNLVGRPDAIGETDAKKIGTITVSITG